MKSLNLTFDDSVFNKMKRIKKILEADEEKRISWENFISGAVFYGS